MCEYLPCPFCGNSNIEIQGVGDWACSAMAAVCHKCGMEGPTSEDPEIAGGLWNKRIELAQHQNDIMTNTNALKAASTDNLVSNGTVWVHNLETGSTVGIYGGLEVHRALVLARHIVDCLFNMINVELPCDQDVIEQAKVVFDEIFPKGK